ncbi:RNA methyltransferase [Microbacterium sp. F2E]|uniref:TrmH family RNA methyltransferase n=1 Tax=Microbacterium sp. F2E TaxID=2895284 RepID=UPI001E51D2AF|nr:RNA methyltransferase [Microbacterium sp. F2E]MCC9053421.1 RNA methyltransferase [Microbacterium sp. F2E]
MPVVRIDDPSDPRLADYRDLTDVALRRRTEPAEGLYIAESAKVIGRAVAAGHRPRSVLVQEKWLADAEALAPDAPIYLVADDVAEELTGYAVHRGALASMQRPALPPVADIVQGARLVLILEDIVDHTNVECSKTPVPKPRRRRIAVLENLVDHANVGSAFRNAAALGIDGVLITPACADPLYRRAIKTSMGNVFNVPWTRGPKMPEMLETLKAHGYTTVAFTLSDDSITLDELVQRDLPAIAMIFGTEGAGVDPRTARQVDLRVKIPMEEGVDSLNVAAATAVAFYATR